MAVVVNRRVERTGRWRRGGEARDGGSCRGSLWWICRLGRLVEVGVAVVVGGRAVGGLGRRGSIGGGAAVEKEVGLGFGAVAAAAAGNTTAEESAAEIGIGIEVEAELEAAAVYMVRRLLAGLAGMIVVAVAVAAAADHQTQRPD